MQPTIGGPGPFVNGAADSQVGRLPAIAPRDSDRFCRGIVLSGGVRWQLCGPTRYPIRHAGEWTVLYVSVVLSLVLAALAIYATRDIRRSLVPFFACGLAF